MLANRATAARSRVARARPGRERRDVQRHRVAAHLIRAILVAALALGLAASARADAPSRQPSGQLGQLSEPRPAGELLSPSERVDGITAGEAMGEVWYRGYTLPADQNQLFGNGQPCLRLGRTGSVLVGLAFQPVPCTIDRNTTVLIWGITATCDSFDPDSEFYGADEAAQRRCAVRAVTSAVASVELTVDGRGPVDLRIPRFAIFSPQRRVVVRADNFFGYDPGPGSFTAWGYMAWLRGLPPGQHTIRTETTGLDGSLLEVNSLVINVRG